ncbi:MAG: hypothetical protein GY870_05905 [archaeon]|nr:hypothetical protein [archaeon]
MAEPFLCLEPDKTGIRAKIVEQGHGKTSIKSHCHILFKDLPHEKSDNSDIIDPFEAGMDMVAQTLDLEPCSKAIIFVSDRLISFRNLELPFKSEKKIKQILPLELETHLPYNNQTFISDFHMLKFAGDPNGPKDLNLILSSTIAQSQIENYFLKLSEYNIVPSIITPLGYAAAIGFLQEILRSKKFNKFSDFAFVHVTDQEITLALIQNRQPCSIRTISNTNISSDHLAVMVEQTIIGFNQRAGQKTFFYTHVCIDENIKNREQILNAFETNLKNPYMPEVKLNSNALLSNISLDKNEKYLFNFCKGKYGSNSFLKSYSSNIAASAVLLLCLLAFLVISAGFDNKKLENQIAQIDGRAFTVFKETFPDKTRIHDPYLQMKANVQSFMKSAETRVNGDILNHQTQFKIVQIIGELSQKIVDSMDVDISRLLFNKERLVLSGATDNFNNVDRIKGIIESSQMFKTVNISSAAADKKGNQVNFKFIIEM